MKKLFLLLFLLPAAFAFAQPGESTPQETARNFMRTADWNNAILVLNRAIQADPQNLELQKDLALSYYYKRDFAKAMEQVKPMVERDDADEPVFQIAGNVYRALEMVKDADKAYKKGLKKFPDSGPLNSEYGEFLWAKNDYSAIKYWEHGIEKAPSYAGNYYNAAIYYYFTKDKVWTLVYGEIFVNMEYLTERSTEIKKLLLSTYKEKLFNDIDPKNNTKYKSDFAKAVLQSYQKQVDLTARGINIETLTQIRTKFILDWFNGNAAKFPFKLFDYQQQLIRNGMFEAYNQWLFGTVESLPAFDQWTKANAEAYAKFTGFQSARVFKMPTGQHYQEL